MLNPGHAMSATQHDRAGVLLGRGQPLPEPQLSGASILPPGHCADVTQSSTAGVLLNRRQILTGPHGPSAAAFFPEATPAAIPIDVSPRPLSPATFEALSRNEPPGINFASHSTRENHLHRGGQL